MRVFSSLMHRHHHPANFFAFGAFLDFTPDIPDRAEQILATLTAEGHEIVAATNRGREAIAEVHSPDYLDYLRTAWGAYNEARDEMGMTDLGTSREVYPLIFPVRGMDHGYPSSIVGRAGFHSSDMWMPLGAESWKAIEASANLAVDAADAVVGGDRAAYALCRPSGHHASFERGGGNCYLNNAAIAAEFLRTHVARVALVDIDVHHGNGTQDLFYDRDDVLFVSLHCDPNECYPYFAGYTHERGTRRGTGFNVNLPLPLMSGDEPYLEAVDAAVPRIGAFTPDVLVVSLGVDGHRDDPSRALALGTACFSRVGERLAELGVPTVLIQEGGYNLDTIGECVSAVLAGFEA
ncbi:MAG: histone deacetylase family protein [Actinomycetota bacterium]